MTEADEFMHDDEHKHAADDGEWIASEPPVDDFSDAGGEASASEDHDHDHDHVPEDSAMAAPEEGKKKSPFILLVGAVGCLAIIGGLAYWQFGGHKQEQSLLDMADQGMLPSQASNAMPAPTPAPAHAASAASTQAAAPVDPTSAFGASTPAANTVPASAANSAAVTNDNKMSALQAAEASLGTPPQSAPAPVAVVPAPVVAKSATPVVSLPTSASSFSAGVDGRVAALSSRIDDLQKSLAQATKELDQINGKLSSGSAVAAGGSPELSERVNKVEQKLMQIEQHQSPGSAVESSAPVTAYRQTHMSTRHAAHHQHMTVATKKASVNNWVLRAATPEEAWIASNNETRELRPVHVGDELPGIGRVTAIQPSGNGWVVRGTHGSIQ